MIALRDQVSGANRIPFLALLGANAISLVGTRVTQIALPWFVLQTTGSAAKTGIVGFTEMLPVIIASFFGGTLVDRIGFKNGSVVSDLLAGITIALVPALHHTVGLAFWQLLVLVFLVGLFSTPGMTARQSLVPDLAELAGLPLERANAAYQAIPRLSLLLGPALGAALISLVGPSQALWLDAAGYLLSAGIVLIGVRVPRSQPAGSKSSSRYLDELREGLAFVRQNSLVRTMITVMLVISIVDMPLFSVVLPVYADRVLGSVVALGTIVSVFGAGALAGVLAYGAIGHKLPRRPTLVIAFAACCLSLTPLALEAPLWVIATCVAVEGVISAPINPLAMTLLQEATPAELRGRAFGLVTALGLAVSPLGLLMAGYIVDYAGLLPMLGLIAVSYLAAAAVCGTAPAFRNLSPPAALEPTPVVSTADTSSRQVAGYQEGISR
ncbi:MFS transporter [Sphaerobacter sp.]|uniref:MFS transporter n=1 Tax=Sphaerobacter sp. TaxID=2099654 RepID=UPI001DF90805|nr:MFS transporter [Sphaerobacter sp.]MBX5446444.1 MFS transporter [Sphaerobacter sp.]